MEKVVYLLGGKEITAYIPSKPSYEALENLYDCCNDLFAHYPDCFYTKSQVYELKQDQTNIFHKGVKR